MSVCTSHRFPGTISLEIETRESVHANLCCPSSSRDPGAGACANGRAGERLPRLGAREAVPPPLRVRLLPPLDGAVRRECPPLWRDGHPAVRDLLGVGGDRVGRQVFGVTFEVIEGGSGDTTYDYVKTFCYLVLAVLLGLLWTILDRKRARDPRLYVWFRVYLRLSLALAMLVYGTLKLDSDAVRHPRVLPIVAAVRRGFAHGFLWAFMAASPAYTAFSGAVETLGGLLLIPRRTTLLGALVSAGALTQVVMLNFCYDVPVKLFSSHLLAMALLLAAPDLRRLADLFFFNRRVEPVEMPPLVREPAASPCRGDPVGNRLRRRHRLLAVRRLSVKRAVRLSCAEAALHGVWEVEEMAVDGKVRPRPHRRRAVEAGGRRGTRIPWHPAHQRLPGRVLRAEEIQQSRPSRSRIQGIPKKYVLSYRRPKQEILVMEG